MVLKIDRCGREDLLSKVDCYGKPAKLRHELKSPENAKAHKTISLIQCCVWWRARCHMEGESCSTLVLKCSRDQSPTGFLSLTPSGPDQAHSRKG
jgi:hypothetical protein